MTKEELRKEAEEWLSITDNHFNDERTHFLSESEYAEQAYLAGAEPREKRIAELEKENTELKKQVEQKQHLADVRLEQSLENYKLFSDERKARIDVDIALEDMTNNLTKAKEIIKELVRVKYADFTNGDYSNELSKVLEQAEQFLSKED